MSNLKPLFALGEEVVAAWWDNEERTGKSLWFPGKIKSYQTTNSRGKYGPLRKYHIVFDDGDEIDHLDDYWVFSKDDYKLMDRKRIGVTNVVDEKSDDSWAKITGWYVVKIGDEEQSFSRLSHAMKAYDDYAVHMAGETNANCLNIPENYTCLLGDGTLPKKKNSGNDCKQLCVRKRGAKKNVSTGRSRSAKSTYRGVHWQINRKKWMARYSIAHNGGKNINLGAFTEEKHAALAFDAEARRQGRPASDLNFPNEFATEEDIISWKGNHYKTMTKNGKLGSSKYRGVCKNGRRYQVQCNINAVKDGLGCGSNVQNIGYYNDEVKAAHVFDYVCRAFGVPEHELNFPRNESAELTSLARAGAQAASIAIENIKSRIPVEREPFGYSHQTERTSSRNKRRRVEEAHNDNNDDNDDNRIVEESTLFEVEAFVSRPSSSEIEVKWVGSYTRTIKTENELREELDISAFNRLHGLLDRWQACSVKEYSIKACLDITHDDDCMVCGDGGELICCETCPCVVHQSCIELRSTSHRWRCAICRCQAPSIRFSEDSVEDELSCESNDHTSDQEEDEYYKHVDSSDADSEFDYDNYYFSSSDQECDQSRQALVSVEEKYERNRNIAKAALGRSGNRNGAKPVEKLSVDGTVLEEFRSKREAVLSLGMSSVSNLSLKDTSSCIEYQGFFWRLKGSSALPSYAPRILKSNKPVEQLCLQTGEVVKRYNSISEASRAVKISAPSISNICNGWQGHNSAAGYGWRYSNNNRQERENSAKDASYKMLLYPPIDSTNRRPVEQIDINTGRVIATFKSKTAVYRVFSPDQPNLNVLSCSDFETNGAHAFGFFWRPSKTTKRTTQNKNAKPSKISVTKKVCQLYGEEVVGQSLEVYIGKRWKKGTITSYDSLSYRHIIQLAEDDTSLDLVLSKEKLRWDRWKNTQFGFVDDECPICFEEPMNDPAATVCGHIFCMGCISTVIETRRCCPICMLPLEGNNAKLSQKGTEAEETPDAFRAVEQVCMQSGDVLRVFSSAAAASAIIGQGHKKVTTSGIILVCKGAKGSPKSAAGFAWRFHGSSSKTQLIGDRAIDGKAVEKVDANTGVVVESFMSVRSAAETTKLSRPIISAICQKRRRDPFHGGFFWRYQGEESKPWSPRKPAGIPVEQISLVTGKVLAEFPSAAKAMEKLVQEGKVASEKWKNYKEKGYGITSDIGSVCRLERRSAYGYFWRYKDSNMMPQDYQLKQGSLKAVRRISVATEKVLQEYPSATEAYREFEGQSDFTYSSLCRACREGIEYGGYYWEYIEN